ncbi:hypothetical protein RDV64_21430 [Acuticoccus sp. MNP-M23]|uniref:fumarylacetoacetate hydrolase family protein n=1 Tax=Acuticoccus sp. MNP-M23 TaxID=3072793 RepID=UPI0028152FBF|nr:fumarylacetoacetate hydrolase family protein [Acuticoccus sp. MNP-M23]WMS42593.1 hypothetical protein RDV64_21430 [Acuticoccus sp. MNP-M23]
MVDAERLSAAFRGEGRLEALESPPQTVDAAYALQDAVREAIGKPIVGWKVAQTTARAQAAAGIEAPTVAPLLEGMIVPADTVFPSGRFYRPEVEAEIALELRRAITAPLSGGDLVDRLAGVRLAIEVADSRYTDKPSMGAKAVIADMNSCGALVVGPLLDLGEFSGAAEGDVLMRLGDGTTVPALPADMRPKPIEVLEFLVRFVIDRGHTLPAGCIITTGTHTAPTVSGPGVITADFRTTGKVNARLSAAHG